MKEFNFDNGSHKAKVYWDLSDAFGIQFKIVTEQAQTPMLFEYFNICEIHANNFVLYYGPDSAIDNQFDKEDVYNVFGGPDAEGALEALEGVLNSIEAELLKALESGEYCIGLGEAIIAQARKHFSFEIPDDLQEAAHVLGDADQDVRSSLLESVLCSSDLADSLMVLAAYNVFTSKSVVLEGSEAYENIDFIVSHSFPEYWGHIEDMFNGDFSFVSIGERKFDNAYYCSYFLAFANSVKFEYVVLISGQAFASYYASTPELLAEFEAAIN